MYASVFQNIHQALPAKAWLWFDDLAFCQNLVKTSKVGLVPGSAFGAEQEGWLRLCFASKIDTLDHALNRLESAISD